MSSKMKIWKMIALSILLCLGSGADAQQPGTPGYNTRVLPAHGMGDTRAQSAVDRWGAVAVGKDDGLGWATGFRSEQDAQEAAVNDCLSSGGRECKSDLSFVNGCAVVAFWTKKVWSS